MIKLKEVTQENFKSLIELKVAENQKSFVAPNVYSLAQAYVFNDVAHPFAIYLDDEIVGFVMMDYYKPSNHYSLWRLMIDEKYQGKGYGKAGLIKAVDYMFTKFKIDEFFTYVVPENTVAKNLYLSLGFVDTGKMDGIEMVMKVSLEDFTKAKNDYNLRNDKL